MRASHVIVVGEVLELRQLHGARILRAAADLLEAFEHRAVGTLAGDLAMVLNDKVVESGFVVPFDHLWFEAKLEVERALVVDERSRRALPDKLRVRFPRSAPPILGSRVLVLARRKGRTIEAFVNGIVPVSNESELEDTVSAVLAARRGEQWPTTIRCYGPRIHPSD